MKAIIVALLLATCTAAIAAPDASAVSAREHTKKGYALYALGKYRDAAAQFEDAYAARPEAGLLFNAAQAARLGGDLRKAQTLYSSYVSFHPDGANLAEAKMHLEKLDVAIKAEDAARKTSPPAPPPEDKPVVEPAAPPPPPPVRHADERPLVKKWWFWTAIGGVVLVAATAITLGVVLTRPAPAWSNVPDVGPGAAVKQNALVQLRF